jgi:hypothetical protein
MKNVNIMGQKATLPRYVRGYQINLPSMKKYNMHLQL